MEYFSQFKWPVSFAFADALGRCQFGEGDVLYPNKSAYKDGFDIQNIDFCFQVMYPARLMNVPIEDVSEVFKKNWNSEVRIQKYSPGSENLTKDGDLISTTQGRLYTSLWKGDLKYLESDFEEPVMPIVDTREAVKLIKGASKVKTNRLEHVEDVALKKSKGNTVFVMPYDRSNSVSVTKYFNIVDALGADLTGKPTLLTAKAAGIDDWDLFLPTVNIALFITPNLDAKALHEKVKKATYVKSKNRKTDRDAYDIRKHGHIFG